MGTLARNGLSSSRYQLRPSAFKVRFKVDNKDVRMTLTHVVSLSLFLDFEHIQNIKLVFLFITLSRYCAARLTYSFPNAI